MFDKKIESIRSIVSDIENIKIEYPEGYEKNVHEDIPGQEPLSTIKVCEGSEFHDVNGRQEPSTPIMVSKDLHLNSVNCGQVPLTTRTINALDFGVKAGEEYCNYEAFEKAINYCREIKANKLILPKGVYHFKTKPSEEGKAQVNFCGLSNFIFDGQGSELIFSCDSKFISIHQCEKAVFKDFILDWDWDAVPLSSLGRVIEVAEDGSYFDCKFPSYKDIPEHFEIKMVGPFDAKTFKYGYPGAFEFRPYKNNFIVETDDEEADKAMKELVRELSNIIKSMKKVSSDVMRFYTVDPVWSKRRIKAGQVYNFRHYEYESTAVMLTESNNFVLDNVTIYSCPGSGFVGRDKLHHFAIKNCKITRRPGTDRPLSTTVDSLHIGNSQGHFIIENCEFAYSGDDCINIHDNTSMGFTKINDNTIIADRVDKVRNRIDIGDILEFRNSDFSDAGFLAQVIDLEYNDEKNNCKLVFNEKIPENVKENSIIFNKRYSTENYIIRNNKFHSNRARGILIHGSNGLIEGNHFYNTQGAAIQIESGAETRWSEGTGVRNVIFRDNVIESCDVNRWVMAVIYMGVYLPEGRTDYPVFDGIIFENNTIIDCPRLAWYLSSCSNIFLLNNAVINPNTAPLEGRVYGSSQEEFPIYGEEYKGTITIAHGKDVLIQNNKRVEYVDTNNNGIYFEKDTTNNIVVKDNVGFHNM